MILSADADPIRPFDVANLLARVRAVSPTPEISALTERVRRGDGEAMERLERRLENRNAQS